MREASPALGSALHPRLVGALHGQMANRRALLDAGARHVGWKLAGAIAEIDELTHGAPLSGYLTSATVHAHGATCHVPGARALRAETEVLIQLVGAAGDPAAAVVGVAIELVDVARPPHAMEEIVAANVFHRAAIVGPARAGALPAAAPARLWIDGELRETAPVTTDVGATVARLANVLAALEQPLRAGDLILAGSLIHVPVSAGSSIAAEIEGVGRVEATVAA
jgi:2-keto-4-pentenoate hydratase